MATTFRNAAATVTIQLVTETCSNCGVVFAMTTEFRERKRQDHSMFYCPAGHVQHYTGENEAEKARKRAEQLERQLESQRGWSDRLEKDLAAERKQHASTKGQLTKTRKRVQAGVCPVDGCRRHFTNLEGHMRTQHPEVSA